MAAMRNGNNFANPIGLDAVAVMGAAAASRPLRHGAAQTPLAPTSSNGCISEISSAAIRSREHDYTDAMKNYGAVYEAYQAYLMPAEHTPAHDYDIAAKPVSHFNQLGCLNADLFDAALQEDAVSDDDIENCGYMAWVRH